MNKRFLLYIRTKGLTQKKLSELSCVSTSMVSRFCQGGSIASDKLFRLLQVCDDLSLDWLFYGTGNMIREPGITVNNYGKYAGAEMAGDDSLFIKNSPGATVWDSSSEGRFISILKEKERIISEKDRIIMEKDATIQKLIDKVVGKG